MELTRKQLSDLLGVSVSAIRKYESDFADWIHTPPGVKGEPIAKVYSEHDVRVFSLIVSMRREGVGLDDIREQLDERLATTTGELIPAEPVQHEDDEQRVLVAAERELARAYGMLDATEREVEKLTQQVKDLQEQIDEQRERAAKAEGKLELYEQRPPSFWQRLFGGGGDS